MGSRRKGRRSLCTTCTRVQMRCHVTWSHTIPGSIFSFPTFTPHIISHCTPRDSYLTPSRFQFYVIVLSHLKESNGEREVKPLWRFAVSVGTSIRVGGEGRGKRRRAMGDKVQMCLFQRSIIILSCLFMPPLPSPFCHPTHSLFLLYLRWTSSTFPSRCLPRRIISHCSCLTQCHLNLYRHGLNLYVLSAISSVNECRKPLPAMVGRLPLTLVF